MPFDKIWYNAPFDEFLKVRVKLTNAGVRLIGFHLKSTVGPDRIEIDPANGALDANETTTLWVTCKPFAGANTASDRVTVEWTDAPGGAPKKYNRDWFTGDSIVRRKNIALMYNE